MKVDIDKSYLNGVVHSVTLMASTEAENRLLRRIFDACSNGGFTIRFESSAGALVKHDRNIRSVPKMNVDLAIATPTQLAETITKIADTYMSAFGFSRAEGVSYSPFDRSSRGKMALGHAEGVLREIFGVSDQRIEEAEKHLHKFRKKS